MQSYKYKAYINIEKYIEKFALKYYILIKNMKGKKLDSL